MLTKKRKKSFNIYRKVIAEVVNNVLYSIYLYLHVVQYKKGGKIIKRAFQENFILRKNSFLMQLYREYFNIRYLNSFLRENE